MTCLFRSALLLAICTSLVAQLSAQSPTRVQHVAVLGSGQAIEVEIQASGAVVPQSQTITGPDRIVVDFPGALPAAELRTLNVNRGALKTVRAGLFSSNPPVTRVVLDLTEPQSYEIFSVRNVVMLKVGPVKTAGNKVTDASLALASSGTTSAPPPKPPMEVTFQNGLLRIHTERATLAQVLFEVQRQTGAEIAIPAGAEGEEIVVELGPAPAREVLAALLNGSRYNFIFVGNTRGRNLQKAILSVR
jgi:AMIN domain-containing protein